MATYTTQYDIANRALVHCGISPNLITFTGSKNAVLMGFLYDKVRVAELRRHVWNFAINYSTLSAASPPTRAFANGQTKNSWALPSDYLRIATQDPRNPGVATLLVSAGTRYSDFQIEGGNLLTLASSVTLRYVNNFSNVAAMDPTFCEALAAALALAATEVITQNPGKRQLAQREYDLALYIARTTNLIEGGSAEPAEEQIDTSAVKPAPQVNAASSGPQQAPQGRSEGNELVPR